MPAQGIVVVNVTPLSARMIAWWLRSYVKPTEYEGLLAPYLFAHTDHHDVGSIAAKFEKVIGRKRRGGLFKEIAVQLSREDAEWFAGRVRERRGFFGRRITAPSLPVDVQLLCYRCLEATSKRRGRRRLSRDRLQTALNRKHLDERHRKRLRKRQREEAALDHLLNRPGGLIGLTREPREEST